jgi:hypothetical protein
MYVVIMHLAFIDKERVRVKEGVRRIEYVIPDSGCE